MTAVSRITLGLCCWLLTASAPLSAADIPPLRPGRAFLYHREDLPKGPWTVHVVKVDRNHPNIELHTTLGGGEQLGLAPLSEQMKSFPRELGRPIAAVNGDYFWDEGAFEGDPKGLQIKAGELISAPCDWTAFWIDHSGQFQMTNVSSRLRVKWADGAETPIGLNEERKPDNAVLYTAAAGSSTSTEGGAELILEKDGDGKWLPLAPGEVYSARVREVRQAGNTPLGKDVLVLSFGPQLALPANVEPGTQLQIVTETVPNLKGAKVAMGGGPALVRNGEVVQRDEIKVRNPRTAIGWNKDHLYLVQVDGRQLRVSVGMSNDELADYMKELGCEQAMSLDGGGSATCWVYGQVMNRPSEGFERPMANSFVVIQKPRK